MNVIAHNLSSMFSSRQLNITTSNKAKSTEKLSSGYKINRAADDAAGLSISEKMRRQIRGLNSGKENCQDAVSFNQISDGAMNEVSDMLLRMKELAVHAANGTMSESDRNDVNNEITQIVSEIDRIERSTKFNERKVFGTELVTSIYTPASAGKTLISQTVVDIPGRNIGLAQVLNLDGGNHISTAKKLTEPLTFSGGGWTSTGDILFTKNGNIYSSYSLSDIVSDIHSASGGTISTAYLANAIEIGNFSLNRGDYSVLIDYSTTAKDFSGNYVAQKIELFKRDPDTGAFDYSGSPIASYALKQDEGSIGLDDGKTYPSVWMDFSGLGTTYTVDMLYGEGFNTTCCHGCGRYYSVEFTDSSIGGAFTFSGSGRNPVLKLNISGCTTGDDIVQAFMAAVNSPKTAKFTDHYQQYAYNSSEPGKLYVYDNSPSYYPNGGGSTFEPFARDESGKTSRINVTYTLPDQKIVTYETRDIWIQSGAENTHGFYIQRACCNSDYLGVSHMDVTSLEGAREAIDQVDVAAKILSAERSMVGAQQNRCENAIKVNANTIENTTAAESRIRDTDMAKEMVRFSKENILQQVGQAMLSQANQDPQSILSLLQ